MKFCMLDSTGGSDGDGIDEILRTVPDVDEQQLQEEREQDDGMLFALELVSSDWVK